MDQQRPQNPTQRPQNSDRAAAMAALQRALDRRDNGGSTGHQ
ncbi:hypothetical protein [Streptacidiphilus sp. EB103A]